MSAELAIVPRPRRVPIVPAAGRFGMALRRYRVRVGLSQNMLGKLSGMSTSYINRMESGERDCPTREVVDALADALRLSETARESLLLAAGHAPESSYDPTVCGVAWLLAHAPEEVGDSLAIQVRALLEAYRPSKPRLKEGNG